MGVLAHVERPIGALAAPIITNGLGNGQNMALVERAVQGSAAVAAGAKAHQLVDIARVGLTLEIIALKPGRIDEHVFGSRLSRESRNWHIERFLSSNNSPGP